MVDLVCVFIKGYHFLASGLFIFCHTDRSGAYLVIRSAILYITGFLDCARNDSKNKGHPQKIFVLKKIFGKKEQSLCGLTIYNRKWLTCFAYCDALDV